MGMCGSTMTPEMAEQVKFVAPLCKGLLLTVWGGITQARLNKAITVELSNAKKDMDKETKLLLLGK